MARPFYFGGKRGTPSKAAKAAREALSAQRHLATNRKPRACLNTCVWCSVSVLEYLVSARLGHAGWPQLSACAEKSPTLRRTRNRFIHHAEIAHTLAATVHTSPIQYSLLFQKPLVACVPQKNLWPNGPDRHSECLIPGSTGGQLQWRLTRQEIRSSRRGHPFLLNASSTVASGEAPTLTWFEPSDMMHSLLV